MHVRAGEAPRHPQPLVRSTTLDFPLEGMTVVLVDDVLYTGRTIRAAIDALFGYGRGSGPAARYPQDLPRLSRTFFNSKRTML